MPVIRIFLPAESPCAIASRDYSLSCAMRRDCLRAASRSLSAAAARRLRRASGTIPYPAADAGKNILYSVVRRAAQAPRSGAVLQLRRGALHRADLRAAAAVPLPEASLRADSADRARGAASRAARRVERLPRAPRRRLQRLRNPHPAGHPLPAAPGVRARREPLYLDRASDRSAAQVRSRFAAAARASSRPRTTSTRSSGWRIRACIRRSSA